MPLCRYIQDNSSFGAVKEVKTLPEALECKMIAERETFMKELKDIGNELVRHWYIAMYIRV